MRKITILTTLTLLFIHAAAQTTIDQVNYHILTQNYSRALELSNQLVSNYPDSAYYHYQRAIINKLMYRYPDALQNIKMATDLDGNNIDYLEEYGIILTKKDRDNDAVEIFKQVTAKDSSRIYSGIWLSNYYLKTKKYDEALVVLNKLFNCDTTNSYFARNIGLCWYKKGISKNSEQWFLKAVDLDRTDIKAYKYLFSIYAGKEEFDQAFTIIDKAIHIDPDNQSLYTLKGDLHVIRNHHYQAIPVYLKAYELDKSNEELPAKIGLSYYKVKKFDEAKHYLLIADKMSMNLDVYKHLGLIYKKQNQPDSSTKYFTRALDILRTDNNTIFNIYVDVAENYLMLENYNHSIGWYERALKLELMGIWSLNMKNKLRIDLASVYSDKLKDNKKAIQALEGVKEDTTFMFSTQDYYGYAQKEISRLKEELFFEGAL